MTLRNFDVMYAWKTTKLMIFRTSLYFHENTFVVLIYQNTYEFRQNSVIHMTYVAMTTHIPWLPHSLEKIRYTSQGPLICERMLNHANIMLVLTHTHQKWGNTHFVWVVLLNTHKKYVETTVLSLTSKHTCMTLIMSYTETTLPAWFHSPYLSNIWW